MGRRARFQRGGENTDYDIQSEVVSGSARIRYYICGKGTPFIFLHGNSGNKSCFKYQIPVFSGHYNCILIESRGHGRSTHGREKLSLSLLADDIIKIMDYLKLPPAHILGFSDGGNIAIHMALKAPERIKSLILAGANAHPGGLSPVGTAGIRFIQQILRFGANFSIQIKKRLEIWNLMIYEPNFSKEQLSSIKIPTLITAGEHDIVLKEHSEYLHKCIENSTLKILKGGNHHVNSRLPELFNNTVKNFLNTQEA